MGIARAGTPMHNGPPIELDVSVSYFGHIPRSQRRAKGRKSQYPCPLLPPVILTTTTDVAHRHLLYFRDDFVAHARPPT